ncbi:biopolymer transporter ExbD [Cellvibrio sp. BR]|uniref:ExbD/TolR family protein n=1 Tax=Cellvibrio sp. BR TaxID=1134474 RepID=UPI0005902D98|nr:biopolymer transporter ExbD [Cellvibrio sp. BR]
MKMSRRARRMERNHKKFKIPPLNLVALMDIFTILVFFLLVSSSNTHQLPTNKDLKLPTSKSTLALEDTLVVAITQKDILLSGVSVAKVNTILHSQDNTIPTLMAELKFHAQAKSQKTGQHGRITIMSDENVPYEVIQKVLTSCQQSNYTKIAFAAVQKAIPKM